MASIIGILLIVGGITLYRTFALYEEKLEFNVLKGRIPDFVSGDVQLAMTLDGEAIETFPEGKEYRVKTSCEGAEGTWNYSTWSINIGNIASTKVKCSLDFESIYNITINEVEAKEFPSKEDTAHVNMSCTSGTGSWDATNWKPVVTGLNENTSCEVKFQTKTNIFSYYLDNNKVEGIPTSDKYYQGLTCTKGSASFDKTKWEPSITKYEEGMKCDVKFGTSPMYFNDYLIALSKTDESIVRQEHKETEQTGANATIDYRYIGADPNNYVFLEESGNCSEDQLFRIIGVIPTQSSENSPYENRVKLIKLTSYGKYPWSGSSSNSSNDWTSSTLNKTTLNITYWNSIRSYQKYIDDTKWYLGATGGDNNPDSFYQVERKNQGSSSARYVYSTVSKLGLMYVSDYGFATSGDASTDRDTCLTTLINTWKEENVSGCIENDWLFVPKNRWTIVAGFTGVHGAYQLTSNGGLLYSGQTSSEREVYPVLHLISESEYRDGDGSMSNPYRIEIG